MSSNLSATITELWPNKSKILIKNKGLSVKQLVKSFNKIYFAWNKTYNNYRFMYKLQIQELPLFVIVPVNRKEICKLLNLAYKKKLTLRIIAGRHSSNIQDPDFYVDLSEFDKVCLNHIDCQDILIAGGGINQGRIYEYLFNQNTDKEDKCHFIHGIKMCHPLYSHCISRLINNSNISSNISNLSADETNLFPGGSAGSVCVSGFTTAGGVASFRRTFGLAIDSVQSFKIIVPPNKHCKKAQKLHVTNSNNQQDLFWALCGGVAANFGIVTEIKYVLPKINNAVMYSVVWPWDVAKEVLTLWLQTSPARPVQYNEDISIYTFGNDAGIELGGLYVIPEGQTDAEAIISITAELAIYGGILKTQIVTYEQTMTALSDGRVYYPFSATQIYFSSNTIDVDYVISQMENAKQLNGLYLFGVELLGGKISVRSPSDTAFYPREANFFYDIFAFCQSSLDINNLSLWVTEFFNHTYNQVTDTVFVGFPIPNLPKHLEAYYGTNKNRLISIKEKYDTYGVMNYPQGI